MVNNLMMLYQSRLTDAGGWYEYSESIEPALSMLLKKYPFEKNEIIFSGRVTEQFQIQELPGVDIGTIHPNDRRDVLANAKLGVTVCDGLVAETGTAVLVNHPNEPRELSLLPERHVVIGTSGRLVATLDECLAKIKELYPAGKMPSLTLISGPSRTSDIEKTLVIGVHGPREFGVILIP